MKYFQVFAGLSVAFLISYASGCGAGSNPSPDGPGGAGAGGGTAGEGGGHQGGDGGGGSGGEAGGASGEGGGGGDGGGGGEGGQSQCGNGVVEEAEDCDGDDFGDSSCLTLGFRGGKLGCTPRCGFDVSKCSPMAVCGDSLRAEDEFCEVNDLAGASCETFGFASGTLACDGQCRFEFSGCSGSVTPVPEVEPNDSFGDATPLPVPGVGQGSLRVEDDEDDYWAVEVEQGGVYRVWTSMKLDGTCPSNGEDTSLGVSGSSYLLKSDVRDIDFPSNRCSEMVVEAFSTRTLYFDVTIWSKQMVYFIWVERIR